MKTWREKSLETIRQAHAEYGGDDLDGLEAHIRSQYPFGERKRHPYKTWCKAVRDYMDEQQKLREINR